MVNGIGLKIKKVGKSDTYLSDEFRECLDNQNLVNYFKFKINCFDFLYNSIIRAL